MDRYRTMHGEMRLRIGSFIEPWNPPSSGRGQSRQPRDYMKEAPWRFGVLEHWSIVEDPVGDGGKRFSLR